MSHDPLLTALTSLLPTHTPSTLPRPLVNLASALLAQSRSAAASLKPEEEAARSCAIADIAVERLKTRLNLQKATPAPPCGPRIYKKLYQYLDNALPTTTTTTPTATPTKQRTRDVFSTPTKLSTPSKFATPTKVDITRPQTGGLQFPTLGTPKAGTSSSQLNDEGVPEWISTTIRHTCKKLNVPNAIPHVYVGVATLLRATAESASSTSPTKAARTPRTGRGLLDAAAASRASAETEIAVKIPALIISVLIFVTQRMYPGTGKDKVNVRTAAQEFVALGRVQGKRLREVMVECERLEEDEWERWEGMEWWGNVPVGVAEEDKDTEMVDAEADELGREGDSIVVKRHTTTGMPTLVAPTVKQTTWPNVTSAKKPTPPPPPQSTVPAHPSAAPSAPAPIPAITSAAALPPKPQPLLRKPRPKSTIVRNADDIKPTGLGAIDWLSPARRADYKKWEASILKRIEATERAERSASGAQKSPARVSRKRKAEVLEVA